MNTASEPKGTTGTTWRASTSPSAESRWDWQNARRIPRPSFPSVILLFLAGFTAADLPAAETPRRSNVLRLARAIDPPTLDPIIAMPVEDVMLIMMLYQPIVDVQDGPNLFGNGAAGWTVSPDARRFTFHLRPESRFSNGRSIVSADYAFTLERAANPKTGCPLQGYASGIRGFADFVAGRTNRIAGIATPDPLTLVVELERTDPTFLFILAQMIGFPLPQEEATQEPDSFRHRSVGNGPYRIASWQRGHQIVFDRNPFYAGPLTNRFERVEIMIGGDESTHLMMFERGELDMANTAGSGVPLSDLRRLRNDPRWGPLIEVRLGVNTHFIELNTELAPLDNVKVRQAMNHAVNKPRCMFAATQQFVPAGGALPPSMPGHDPSMRGYPYDPERARQLLAEAGLALPLRMTLWHPNDQMARLSAEAIQADLRDVGVEIELKGVFNAQLGGVRSERRKTRHLTLTSWNPSPDPRDIIGQHFDGRSMDEESSMNGSFYNNPELNRLIDAASVSAEPQTRFRLFQQAERLVVADAPWIFLGYRNLFLLRQPWLKGPILEPFGYYRLDRAWRE